MNKSDVDFFESAKEISVKFIFNHFYANLTKWSDTLKQLSEKAELFECVWPFFGVDT